MSEVDPAVYTVGQTLVSVTNDPRAGSSGSAWPWSGHGARHREDAPPALSNPAYPSVAVRELEQLVAKYYSHLQQFQEDRVVLDRGNLDASALAAQGEPPRPRPVRPPLRLQPCPRARRPAATQ